MIRGNGVKKWLYEEITQKVYELIVERKLKPHNPVPSEGELAKLFRVSRMTTKMALENLQRMGIVYRLQRRGTFLADGYGDILFSQEPFKEEKNEKLAEQKSKNMIAIVVPNLDDYTGSIIATVHREADKYNHSSIILEITGSLQREEETLRKLQTENKVDGIILFPHGRKVCGEELLRMKLDRFPLVVIDRYFREIDIDSVYHDHYRGAYNLTEYLINRGHTKIGYVSRPFVDVTSREDRYQGYVQAMIDHHIAIPTQMIHLNLKMDGHWLTGEQSELREFIVNNREMTAVVCVEDYAAAQVMYTCIRAGIEIPGQLSIVGFSDINFSAMLPVPLTTVKQPTEQLGIDAVKMLFERMHNKRSAFLTVKLKTEIIERKSVKTLNS